MIFIITTKSFTSQSFHFPCQPLSVKYPSTLVFYVVLIWIEGPFWYVLRMDYKLKGLILNCTLKSYTFTPIDSTNMLKVTMNLQVQDPQQEEEQLAQEGKVPGQVQEGFCPGASSLSWVWLIPHPVSLGGPVHAATTAASIIHGRWDQGLHHWWDCLSQEAEKAEKEWDQRSDVNDELWRLDQDLKRKKEELEQLKSKASGLDNDGPVVPSSISGQKSWGASAETRAPKKKNSKQRRHPSLPLEERQEYIKPYLAHL